VDEVLDQPDVDVEQSNVRSRSTLAYAHLGPDRACLNHAATASRRLCSHAVLLAAVRSTTTRISTSAHCQERPAELREVRRRRALWGLCLAVAGRKGHGGGHEDPLAAALALRDTATQGQGLREEGDYSML
jgi:hypothetical protein